MKILHIANTIDPDNENSEHFNIANTTDLDTENSEHSCIQWGFIQSK